MTSSRWLRAVFVPAALVLADLLVAPPEDGITQEDYVVRPTAEPCLRVRPEPNTDAERFTCIPPGTRVLVVGSVPYWREVELQDGRRGWAAKRFLEPVGPVELAAPPKEIPEDAWLEVHFVDVGHGDGIWITTHDDGIEGNGIFEGRNIVIDGGPRRAEATNEMLHYLLERAHRNAVIDAWIMTHPHTDHFPGGQGLRSFFEIERYYDPGFPKEGVRYEAFLDSILNEPVEAMVGQETFDDLSYWGKELRAEILYSYPGEPEGLGSGSTLENNASIVLRLEYGDHIFLFVGDAEGKRRADPDTVVHYVEKLLLDSLPPERLRADVLKAGHHGSESSSSRPFIEAVDPEIVVILAAGRVFGGTVLPDQSVLERYCDHNPEVRIYRTDYSDEEDGGDHVVIRSNGRELEAIQYLASEPAPDPSCDDL